MKHLLIITAMALTSCTKSTYLHSYRPVEKLEEAKPAYRVIWCDNKEIKISNGIDYRTIKNTEGICVFVGDVVDPEMDFR